MESKGFCHYKCTNGIKRHLAVDTLGLPFFTHCTRASVSDDLGLIELLSQNLDYFRAKPMNIPKITILLDHGYHPEKITAALQTLYPQIMNKLRFQLAPKPTKAEKDAPGKTGFVPVATCWGKRTFKFGWNDVRVWSRTLSEHCLMRLPSSIYVLSDSCLSG